MCSSDLGKAWPTKKLLDCATVVQPQALISIRLVCVCACVSPVYDLIIDLMDVVLSGIPVVLQCLTGTLHQTEQHRGQRLEQLVQLFNSEVN